MASSVTRFNMCVKQPICLEGPNTAIAATTMLAALSVTICLICGKVKDVLLNMKFGCALLTYKKTNKLTLILMR